MSPSFEFPVSFVFFTETVLASQIEARGVDWGHFLYLLNFHEESSVADV